MTKTMTPVSTSSGHYRLSLNLEPEYGRRNNWKGSYPAFSKLVKICQRLKTDRADVLIDYSGLFNMDASTCASCWIRIDYTVPHKPSKRRTAPKRRPRQPAPQLPELDTCTANLATAQANIRSYAERRFEWLHEPHTRPTTDDGIAWSTTQRKQRAFGKFIAAWIAAGEQTTPATYKAMDAAFGRRVDRESNLGMAWNRKSYRLYLISLAKQAPCLYAFDAERSHTGQAENSWLTEQVAEREYWQGMVALKGNQ